MNPVHIPTPDFKTYFNVIAQWYSAELRAGWVPACAGNFSLHPHVTKITVYWLLINPLKVWQSSSTSEQQ